MAQTDLRTLPREVQYLLGAGLAVFIFSFFPYYGASFGGHSESVTAWHGWALVGLLLILAATIIVAVIALSLATLPTGPVSWNFVIAALSLVGTVCVVIRSFTLDHGSSGGLDYGLRWGAYLLMIACVAHTVLSIMRLRASGEAMPWANRGEGASAPPAA